MKRYKINQSTLNGGTWLAKRQTPMLAFDEPSSYIWYFHIFEVDARELSRLPVPGV